MENIKITLIDDLLLNNTNNRNNANDANDANVYLLSTFNNYINNFTNSNIELTINSLSINKLSFKLNKPSITNKFKKINNVKNLVKTLSKTNKVTLLFTNNKINSANRLNNNLANRLNNNSELFVPHIPSLPDGIIYNNTLNKYLLTENITLTGSSLDVPVSLDSDLDGQGYTITFTPDSTNQYLFIVDNNDSSNINITNLNIILGGNYDNSGIVAGYLFTIDKCTFTGDITSDGSAGLVSNGSFNFTINNSWYKGNIITNGTDAGCGGFVAEGCSNFSINNCYSHGNISSTQSGEINGNGGFVGANCNSFVINNSYSVGDVSSHNNSDGCGGIVGDYCYNFVVNNCYHIGDVISDTISDGSGGITAESCYNFTLNNCYNIGNVITSDSYGSGGLVGWYNIFYSVNNCFHKGNVITKGNSYQSGGICGSDNFYFKIQNSYVTGKLVNSCGLVGQIIVTDILYNNLGQNVDAQSITTDNYYGMCYLFLPTDLPLLLQPNINQLKGIVLENCYVTGDVTGTSNGLINIIGNDGVIYGIKSVNLKNCYSKFDTNPYNIPLHKLKNKSFNDDNWTKTNKYPVLTCFNDSNKFKDNLLSVFKHNPWKHYTHKNSEPRLHQ